MSDIYQVAYSPTSKGMKTKLMFLQEFRRPIKQTNNFQLPNRFNLTNSIDRVNTSCSMSMNTSITFAKDDLLKKKEIIERKPKVTFADQKGRKLVEIIEIEKYKIIGFTSNEYFYNKEEEDSGCHCHCF